jgi:adenylate cyclase
MGLKLKQRLWEWRGVWIVAPSMAIAIIALRLIGLLQGFELAVFDYWTLSRPSQPPDDRIVIVGLTEEDIQENWPISDATLAQLLTAIKQQQPRVIGLDLYRDVAEPPGHDELMRVYRSTPNLVGIHKAVGDALNHSVEAPPVLQELGQVSVNDLPRDADGKVRRGFFYFKDPDTGETAYSLAFELARRYLEAFDIQPAITEDERKWVKFGDVVFPPFNSNDGGYARTNDAGYQIIVNYRTQHGGFQTVSVNQVLDGEIPSDLMRDRIVLIGSTAESLKDYFDTPYSSTLVGIPQRMAGVEIHANITSHIVSATLDGRALIKTWSEPVEWLWILAISILGAIVSWRWRYHRGVGKILPQIAIAGGIIGISYVAFVQGGWWIPVVPPLLALAGSTVAITAYIARTAADIRHTFGRYLTDEVVATLLETPEGRKMGGERRKITILTSDLRGFTSLSERLPPERVVSILNIYLEAMADAITYHQGTIDEFMGDGILVLFGAPTQRDDDAKRAVACAISMQQAMADVNRQMQALNLPDLEMGIGINTGEVVVGNIGSQKRTKYGVVGSQVNLTYRIESYTVGGQILISESTRAAVGDIVNINGEQQVSPKGVKEPISIYSIVGIDGEYDLYLSTDEEIWVPLDDSVGITFALLEGKHIGESRLEGNLVQLSQRGAEVRSPVSMPPLSNLKVQLAAEWQPEGSDGEFYAKVTHGSNGSANFYIRFTSMSPEISATFDRLYQGCCAKTR